MVEENSCSVQRYEVPLSMDDVNYFSKNGIAVRGTDNNSVCVMPKGELEVAMCLLRCDWKKIRPTLYKESKVTEFVKQGYVTVI